MRGSAVTISLPISGERERLRREGQNLDVLFYYFYHQWLDLQWLTGFLTLPLIGLCCECVELAMSKETVGRAVLGYGPIFGWGSLTGGPCSTGSEVPQMCHRAGDRRVESHRRGGRASGTRGDSVRHQSESICDHTWP
jgi:hypothetical protein